MRRFILLFANALLVASAPMLPSGCTTKGDPFVGTWQREMPDGITMRYTFLADGTARIAAIPPAGPAQTYTASYRVESDSLLTLSDAEGAERFVARVVDDRLVLRAPPSGARSVLSRVQPKR